MNRLNDVMSYLSLVVYKLESDTILSRRTVEQTIEKITSRSGFLLDDDRRLTMFQCNNNDLIDVKRVTCTVLLNYACASR